MIKNKPVNTITRGGALLVSLIRFLLLFVSLFKHHRWQYPLKNFEEDPRYFKISDSIYLAYKYYYRSLMKADKGSGIEQYFHAQTFVKEDDASHVTVSLGGDLMPYEYINVETCKNLWDECGSFFFSSDIVFANLETPIASLNENSLVPEVMIKEMLFNADENMFHVFNGMGKFKGFDVLSIANNHSLDQGENGLMQTMDFLSHKKIDYCGGKRSSKKKKNFTMVHRNGIHIAFIAFTFSLNKFELSLGDEWMCNHIRLNKPDVNISTIVEHAKEARAHGAHLVIASLHMGNAYQPFPSKHVMDNIHRICSEAMIDVVVSAHPHNPQPVEWYNYTRDDEKKKSLIFYSLGDFVAYDIYSLSHLSLFVKLHVRKIENAAKVVSFEILPAYLQANMVNGKLTQLTFKHIEKAILERRTSSHSHDDLAVAHTFYKNILFTSDQRSKIIHE